MTRLQKFQAKFCDMAGAALITSPQNQFYLSGVQYDDGYLLVLPDTAYLLADFPKLIAPSILTELLLRNCILTACLHFCLHH